MLRGGGGAILSPVRFPWAAVSPRDFSPTTIKIAVSSGKSVQTDSIAVEGILPTSVDDLNDFSPF